MTKPTKEQKKVQKQSISTSFSDCWLTDYLYPQRKFFPVHDSSLLVGKTLFLLCGGQLATWSNHHVSVQLRKSWFFARNQLSIPSMRSDSLKAVSRKHAVGATDHCCRYFYLKVSRNPLKLLPYRTKGTARTVQLLLQWLSVVCPIPRPNPSAQCPSWPPLGLVGGWTDFLPSQRSRACPHFLEN